MKLVCVLIFHTPTAKIQAERGGEKMNRQPVDSSRISSVGWENNVLQIEFHNGAVYNYYDVTHNEYIDFMNAGSLGHELSILDKRHKYERVR